MAGPGLPWRALLIAPLATIPVVVVTGLGSSDAGFGSDFVWGLFFALIIGVPFAYIGMALVGLPVFLVLRRFGFARPAFLCLAGVAAPFALFADGNDDLLQLTACLSGLFVALAACRLSRDQLAIDSLS